MYQGPSQDFGLGRAQTTNHTGEGKKRVFKIQFRIFDKEGPENLVGDQFRIGGVQTTTGNVESDIKKRRKKRSPRAGAAFV